MKAWYVPPLRYIPLAAQLPAVAHETEVTWASLPLLRAASPGASIAIPHQGGGAPEPAETAPDTTTSPSRPKSNSGSNRLLISGLVTFPSRQLRAFRTCP